MMHTYADIHVHTCKHTQTHTQTHRHTHTQYTNISHMYANTHTDIRVHTDRQTDMCTRTLRYKTHLIEVNLKSSSCTPATAPLTHEAIALQASPTKSGTENNFAASLASLGSTMPRYTLIIHTIHLIPINVQQTPMLN